MAGARLRALVVDDEAPALEELSWLLGQDSRIERAPSPPTTAMPSMRSRWTPRTP
jgi:hypothetical protein